MTENDGGKFMTAEQVRLHYKKCSKDNDRIVTLALRVSHIEGHLRIKHDYNERICEEDKKFPCPHKGCSFPFRHTSALDDHLTEQHGLALSPISQTTCHLCRFGNFRSRKALMTHEKDHHGASYLIRKERYFPFFKQSSSKSNYMLYDLRS